MLMMLASQQYCCQIKTKVLRISRLTRTRASIRNIDVSVNLHPGHSQYRISKHVFYYHSDKVYNRAAISTNYQCQTS